MTHPLRPGRTVAAGLLAAMAACGAKAPPLPPLLIAPERVADFEVSRLDDRVYVEFDVPSADTTGDVPADIVRVEVYALTTQPDEGEEEEFSEDWLEVATLVGSVHVRPPLLPGMEAPEPAAVGEDEAAEGDEEASASQGERITVVERLEPEAFVPTVVGDEEEERDEDDADDDEEEAAGLGALPYFPPPYPPPVIRSYVAFGISSRGREGEPSGLESVPLADVPLPPTAPAVEYTASSIRVSWEAPDTLRLPVQDDGYDFGDDVTEPPLVATPIIEWGEPSRYVVYDVAADGVAPAVRPERLGSPQSAESHTDGDVIFGETRCYAVRVLDAIGELEIEGFESLATCVVLTDTFAPLAPSGLVAVADDDAISLVWNANSESDLAGYLVLRADAPDATLQPLTPEPLARTTYRDAAVAPGQRYSYAVQAVDTAVPPNLSPPSPRTAETAR